MMGIILGIPWEWQIPDDKAAKRALGYLLCELAGLETVAQMQGRLTKLAARRQTLAATPGMKDQQPPLKPEALQAKLADLWNSIQTEYPQKIVSRQFLLQALDYVLPTDTEEAQSAFLKYVLRSKAKALIAGSGE